MAKIKILMPKITLITTEYPPFYGGVGAYYNNLVDKLSQSIEISVIADKKNALDNSNNFKNVSYINLFNHVGPFKWLKIIFIINKLPKNSLIWAGQLLPVGNACLLAKLFFNQPYFVSLHGLDWQSAQTSLRKKIFAQLILKHAEFITVNSQATLKLLPQKYKAKSVVIYPAVNINTDNSDDSLVNQFNLKTQKYFLTVGRLVTRKGQVQAIKSWLKVKPEYKYVIVGNGPLQPTIESLILEHKLKERVIFITNANNEQTAGLYKHAFAYLFPVQPSSLDPEGFGIVCLEAQSYNLPIITTNCGGIPEAVGNGALLMSRADETEIADNIERLITDNNLYSDLIKKGQENLTSFSWEKSAKIIIDLLHKYEQRA